jgi:hypothetical protein
MITLAFDGPDGSGKTPCVAHIAAALGERGLSVALSRPYRELGEAGYYLWQTDPLKAAAFVTSLIEKDLREAARGSRDFLIFDRHWPTAAVSTTDWRAVDLVRRYAPDHLFLLVPAAPKKAWKPRSWYTGDSDPHWIAYRCLAEVLPGIRRPRDVAGRFDFSCIASEVLCCSGV